jgi:peptidyl-prolyl cis-trans isomerase-like protein 2
MGKNKHSKDRLFITATEWATDYGGKKKVKNSGVRPLPFDHCALSLSPFETPVILKGNGVIFDFVNIVPFLNQYKSDPVTGESMTTKDIIRLNMVKNSDGLWHWFFFNLIFIVKNCFIYF